MVSSTQPQYKVADPICTFIFSGIVLVTTLPIIRDLGWVLMEGVPRGVDYEAINTHLSALPNVRMVHSLHVWALSIDKNACSVHLAIGEWLVNCVSLPNLLHASFISHIRHSVIWGDYARFLVQVEVWQWVVYSRQCLILN